MGNRMTRTERIQVVNGMTFIWHIAIWNGMVVRYFNFRLTLEKMWFATKILLRG